MKIDINSIDKENFIVQPVNFCGVDAILVNPNHIGAKFTKDTLIFRSSIWSNEGELLSASFCKFFNQMEQPGLYPSPESFKDWLVQEKLDGSTAILDYVNSQFNIRTRGTSSYITQNNAKDFEVILENIALLTYLKDNAGFSFVFELVTPNNVIVIRSQTIEYYLLDVIDKANYRSIGYQKVQDIAAILNIKVPKTYNFNNIFEIAEAVKSWRGQEGVVLAYNNFDSRVKLKSDWYKSCHKIKSKLNTFEAIVDLFIEFKYPNFSEFYNKISETFDFEIAESLKSDIEKVCEKYAKFQETIAEIEKSLDFWRGCDRKEAAMQILSKYKENGFSGIAFHLLDRPDYIHDRSIKIQLMK